MIRYLLRRLSVLVPTMIGVTIVSFSLIRMVPGDPVLLLLGERGAQPEVYRTVQSSLGLDQPILQQYWVFVRDALHGNLGESIQSRRPVWQEFKDRFPATVELGMAAMLMAIFLGIPIGIIAAVKRNSVFDYSFITLSLVGYSMPIFWWGLILILFFSVLLGWTPVAGRIGVEFDIVPRTGLLLIDTFLSGEGWPAFKSAVSHIILPAIALGTIPLAVISRMTRSSLLEVLGEDYIRTAQAKGLTRARVIGVHALRNAMVPILTVIGLMFGTIVTGAILTETIFSWPGIGKWIVNSVTSRDYPVIQGGILLIAVAVVSINLLVDLLYAVANPRLRDLM